MEPHAEMGSANSSGDYWEGRKQFVVVYRATILVVLLTIMVVGITINSLVLWVIGKNREMQTATNFYVANLAVADIILLVVTVIPIAVTLHINFLGRITCKFLEYIMHISVQATCLTLMAMTIDRYNIIVHAIRSRRTRTTRKALLVNIYIWTGALILQLPVFLVTEFHDMSRCGVQLLDEGWNMGYHFYVLAATYLVPLLVILCCYLGILFKVWQKTSRGTESAEARHRSNYRKRRITRMVIFVVIAFALCWLPHNIRRVWQVMDPNYVVIFLDNWELMNIFDAIVIVMSYSDCLINPLVYAIVTVSFRKHLSNTFCSHMHSGPQVTGQFVQKQTTNDETLV